MSRLHLLTCCDVTPAAVTIEPARTGPIWKLLFIENAYKYNTDIEYIIYSQNES